MINNELAKTLENDLGIEHKKVLDYINQIASILSIGSLVDIKVLDKKSKKIEFQTIDGLECTAGFTQPDIDLSIKGKPKPILNK